MASSNIDANSYMLHLTEFNVLICRTCQHGLTRDGVGRHFQWHHQSIANSVRKQLVSFAAGLHISNSEEITLPSLEIEAINRLEVIEEFACQASAVLHGTSGSIQKHCRKRHGWVRSNGINF